jgi:two-component system, response regulator PdtaR
MILLIEDDAISRTSFAETLLGYGYDVLEAGNAAEALALVSKHRADIELVITDMVLPGQMNGMKLIENMQLLLPNVPMIMVSAYLSQGSGDVILRGKADFLKKPIRPPVLLAAVQRHVPQTNH